MIKVGDLVMVVKPRQRCGCNHLVGRIFVVSRLGQYFSLCVTCGDRASEVITMADLDGYYGADISRLRRIPPLEELDHTKIVEELTTHE